MENYIKSHWREEREVKNNQAFLQILGYVLIVSFALVVLVAHNYGIKLQ